MFIIKTQRGKLINMEQIESIEIAHSTGRLYAFSSRFGEGNCTQYVLYEDRNKEHLEKALDALFNAMTNDNIFGFDFSVTSWEGEQNG